MAKKAPKVKALYVVVMDTATRKSIDPESPDFEEWINYAAGDKVTEEPPAHADVEGWLESGHWERADG